ncbi:organic hydroperoxide resistance protein [Echinicola vietnamensis]|uniref:Peroxiredoxin, Ohr subfamily n=1 Tax=Echinicola vietnamensis (strain DSM 17526 / LMG 23754 / KMM 6221) TaxID=926556 RepID=L0G420_ECHVK|nr:organic hydroperoxide resistance protein [Echinicola vietnamensis]AGA79565.1 peroxiredoxin, Ohr subfamily [Echinicola vietnamensis DSM 17526]
MKTIFETRATAVGGRNGHVKSEDGILDFDVKVPTGMGGKGGEFTNPEQLFAAGYSACFDNAVIHVASMKKAKIQSQTTATVGLAMTDDKRYELTVSLEVSIKGADQATAEDIVNTAHATCPYSNAVKGNVNVAITVKAEA